VALVLFPPHQIGRPLFKIRGKNRLQWNKFHTRFYENFSVDWNFEGSKHTHKHIQRKYDDLIGLLSFLMECSYNRMNIISQHKCLAILVSVYLVGLFVLVICTWKLRKCLKQIFRERWGTHFMLNTFFRNIMDLHTKNRFSALNCFITLKLLGGFRQDFVASPCIIMSVVHFCLWPSISF
jgi:hypothetical protein